MSDLTVKKIGGQSGLLVDYGASAHMEPELELAPAACKLKSLLANVRFTLPGKSALPHSFKVIFGPRIRVEKDREGKPLYKIPRII